MERTSIYGKPVYNVLEGLPLTVGVVNAQPSRRSPAGRPLSVKDAQWTADLLRALRGGLGAHQRLLLDSHLRHLDLLDEDVARWSQEVQVRLAPCDEAMVRRDAIPGIGIGRTVAEDVLAETATAMTRFPTTAAHFCSWARLAPGNHERAGKRKRGRTEHGNRWLRRLLVQAARAAARTKETYLRAQYQRVKARRGENRAALAVAHSILVSIYYVLQQRRSYEDLGGNYFDQPDREATIGGAVRRLEHLGLKVTVEAA